MKSILKNAQYILEALVVKIAILFFRILGYKRSSNIAAKIAIFIGRKLAVNKLADNNLSNAMPHLSKKHRDDILHDMWDNLGRIVGEYYHINNMSKDDFDKILIYSDNFKKNIEVLKKSKKGGIIMTGHIGNWEIGPRTLMSQGLKSSVIYRPLNNPYVEKITAAMRDANLIKKSASGNRKIIEAIKNGEYVVIMADQKVSEGEPVKFFHEDVMTATSIARIALKYDVPIIPARVIRLKSKHEFMIDMDEPLQKNNENIKKDLEVIDFTATINRKLEFWIKEFPDQWFWVHNRWKK